MPYRRFNQVPYDALQRATSGLGEVPTTKVFVPTVPLGRCRELTEAFRRNRNLFEDPLKNEDVRRLLTEHLPKLLT